jgi:hypothetical protein
MAGIVQGQYGLGISVIFWIIILITIGFIGAGIYCLIKPTNKK